MKSTTAMIKYIVKLHMTSTQDCVRPYVKEVVKESLKEARILIKDLKVDYKKAFNIHQLGFEYDYDGVENKVYKVISKTIEYVGLNDVPLDTITNTQITNT